MKALLKKNVSLLLSGQLISELGSAMQSFALSLYVLTKTHSEVAFASIMAIAIIPRFFGPFTGVITDRINRKHMIVALDIAAGAVTLGFAAWHQFVEPLPLAFVYLFVVLLSAIQTFYTPTIAAIIPELAEGDELRQVNVASSVISSITLIIGPAIAPIFQPDTNAGLMMIMIINGLSFLFAAVIETFFRNKSALDNERTTGKSVLDSLKEGWYTVIKNRELLTIVILSICANFALYPIFNVGVPLIMYIDVHVSNELFGLSKSIQYIGPIAGSLLAGMVLKRMDYKKLLVRIFVADGVLIAFMAGALLIGRVASNPLPWQFACINLAALCLVATIVLADISITTTLQRIVPGHLMGRVSGVDTSLSMVAIPLGQMLFSLLSNQAGAMAALLAFAVFSFLSGILAHYLYKPMLNRDSTPPDVPSV